MHEKNIDVSALSPAEKRRMLAELAAQRWPRSDRCPLSGSQRHLWRLTHEDPTNPGYLIGGARRLRGELDVLALQSAIDEIVRRHEPLRTRYPADERDPEGYLAVDAPRSEALPILDLSQADGASREAELLEVVAHECRRPMHVAHGPVFRCLVIRISETDHVLVRVIHRLSADGWSVGILDYELITLYSAFAAGRPSPLPELPSKYSDFARADAERTRGERARRDVSFWRQYLANAPRVLHRMADRLPRTKAEGAHVFLALPDPLIAAAKECARREEVTLFVFLLAVFDVVLANATGELDLVVGYPMAHRDSPQTKPLIGLFASLLAVRSRLPPEGSFVDALRVVRDAALESQAHSAAPFADICNACSEGNRTENPFEVLFLLQLLRTPRALPEGLLVESVRPPRDEPRFEFALTVWERDTLVADFEYSTARFRRETVERFAHAFSTALERVTTDPTVHWRTLPGRHVPAPASPLPAEILSEVLS